MLRRPRHDPAHDGVAQGDALRTSDPHLGFLGLEFHGGGRSRFELTGALARLDGRLYGGTAVAVAVAAMEVESGRDAPWITVQFVGTAMVGEHIECETELLAAGRRVTQVRVTGRVGDRIVFDGLGATGETKDDGSGAEPIGEATEQATRPVRPAKPAGQTSGGRDVTSPRNAFGGQFEPMPEVPAPEDSPPFDLFRRLGRHASNNGFAKATEFRWALKPEPAGAQGGRLALWARVVDHEVSPALLGYVADFVPMAVVRAGGRLGAGTSLDNTIRFGPRLAPDWVLVELDPHLAYGGYGHGTVHLWAPDGTLLATGSQTASLLFFE